MIAKMMTYIKRLFCHHTFEKVGSHTYTNSYRNKVIMIDYKCKKCGLTVSERFW